MGTTVKDDYINGSDLLLNVGGKAIGHCTTHTTTFNSDTKERAVKPVASASKTSGLWKGKGVTGLSIQIKADGLRVHRVRERLPGGRSVVGQGTEYRSPGFPPWRGQCPVS